MCRLRATMKKVQSKKFRRGILMLTSANPTVLGARRMASTIRRSAKCPVIQPEEAVNKYHVWHGERGQTDEHDFYDLITQL